MEPERPLIRSATHTNEDDSESNTMSPETQQLPKSKASSFSVLEPPVFLIFLAANLSSK